MKINNPNNKAKLELAKKQQRDTLKLWVEYSKRNKQPDILILDHISLIEI